jgi:hypothetical protein
MADEYKINPSALDRLEAASIDPTNPIGFTRTLGGYVTDWATNIPSVPTALYDFASEALKAGTNASVYKDDDSNTKRMARHALNYFTPAGALRLVVGAGAELPGAEGAHEITKAIEDKGREWGSAVAGRELQPGILNSGSTADTVGTIAKTVGSMIPITGGWIKTGFEAIKNVKTGVEAINKVIPTVVEGVKFLSPFVPTKTVAPLLAVSAGIGIPATVGAEVIQDKINQQKVAEFTAGMRDLNDEANNVIVQGSNDAVSGIDQAAAVKSKIDNAQSIEQFTAGLKPLDAVVDTTMPVSTSPVTDTVNKAVDFLSEHKWIATAMGAVGVAAGVAMHKNNVINAKMTEWVGGNRLGKSGMGDAVTKPNFTDMPYTSVAKAQGTDAALPLAHYSDNPEVIRAKFENIASATNAGIATARSTGKFHQDSNVRLDGGRTLTDVETLFKTAEPAVVEEAGKYMNATTEIFNRRRKWLAPESGTASTALRKAGIEDSSVDAGYRSWLAAEKAAPNAVVADVERKFSFHQSETPYDDLLAITTNAKANPEVMKLIDAYKDVTRKSIDYRYEQGLITKADYQKQIRAHPEYYPVRIEGSHLNAQELTEAGGRIVQGNPVTELLPYLSEVFKNVAHEKLKNVAIPEQIAMAASGNVRSQKLLGKEIPTESINQYNKDKVISYRDDMGVRRNREINDPLFRDALMPGASTAAIRLNSGFMRVLAFPARMTEEFSTGPSAAFVGSPFAMGNFVYGVGAVLSNRPAGTIAGWGDALVQGAGAKFRGNPVGLRGDLSYIAQSGIQAVNNVVARMAQHGALAIEKSMGRAWNAPALGNGATKTLGKAMANHWKSSMLHEMETYGLTHGAGPMIQQTSMTMAELERGLSAATLASKGYKGTRNFVHDILGAVGNAPLTSFYKQNKGRMSQEELVHTTRNVMGNPSRAGLGTSEFGKVVVGATNISPWGTVTVQSLARFAEAARTNPLGTTSAIAVGVAIPSMMATYWNIAAGKEYLKYQTQERTPEQAAAGIYIAIPGRPANEGIEWRVDQLMRIPKAMVDIIHGHMYGLFDGSIFDERNDDLRRALVDSIGTRYGIDGDVMHSAASQLLPAVATSYNVAAGLMGSDQMARSYIDPSGKVANNRKAGATDSTSKIIDNNWFGYPVSAKFEATISAVSGQVGTALLGLVNGVSRAKEEGLSKDDILKDMGTKTAMNFGRATREVSGPLWGHAATLSPSQEASSKALQPQLESMKKLEAAHNTLNKNSGSGDYITGSKLRGYESLLGVGLKQFKDEEMGKLAFAAQNFLKLYNKQFTGQLITMYDQRASLLSSEKLSPIAKRDAMNAISKEITAVNQQALSAVNQWKWRMSTIFNKNIDLYNIDVGKPITQFKDLLESGNP